MSKRNVSPGTDTYLLDRQKHSRWAWIGISALILTVALGVGGEIMIHRAGPILKDRIEETLRSRFHSRVALENLDVSVFRGLEVSGDRLLIYPPASVVAAGATEPLIAIRHFSFHSGVIGLFFQPMRVSTVRVTGLQINIPPREMRQQSTENSENGTGKMKIVVDEIVCDQSRLIIGTSNPTKDPKDFDLKHIDLRNVGPDAPWKYDAILTNAIPRGEIHATGTFGPWQTDSPGDSTVTGAYSFQNADLNTIKGISGVLTSTGNFNGQLNKIVVDGTTETPDFSLDTANHSMPLHTQFHAIVDGTTGDTYLQSVNATLHNSSFTVSGEVINIKGQGHRINLDLDVPGAQLQDFLDLAVRTRPPVMTAGIKTTAKLQIRPGKESVSQKLGMQANFTLHNIHFTDPKVQDKVDMLSLRAQGEPKEARPGAKDVDSQMDGKFQMADGLLHFSDLHYALPGARVNLTGIYSLDGQSFDFDGKVLTDATLSQMVASPWASFLLKAVSPFFKKKGGGAEFPVSISGTQAEPKFGLDVLNKHAKADDSTR
jgi:AsmA-like C-terminal region